MITKRDVVKYYIAMFDRIPEKEAVDHWYSEAIKNNWSEKDFVSNLFNTAVSVVNNNKSIQDIYPQYVNFNNKDLHSVISVIEGIYKSLFDKSFKDDPDGIVNWTIKIISNQTDMADAIISIEHFAENVHDGKIDLKQLNYSDEDIKKVEEAVNTYYSRVNFAYEASEVIDKIKVNDDSLKILQDSVNMIHSSEDYIQAVEFLEKNIEKVVAENKIDVVSNELNTIFINKESDEDKHNSLIESGENLGFIDLPLIEPHVEDICDIHYF